MDVLIDHLRLNITSCRCGWSDLGRSHAGHVAAALAAAGYGPMKAAAAGALRDAASSRDKVNLMVFTWAQREWLRERAAAIEAEP